MPCGRVATLLTVEVRTQPPDLLVLLHGDLDVLSASFLQLPHPRAFDEVRRLVVDLSGLRFCDLTGVRRLAHLHADYAAGGFDVQLVGAPPPMRRAAQVAGLDRALWEGEEPDPCRGGHATGDTCGAGSPRSAPAADSSIIEQRGPLRVQPA